MSDHAHEEHHIMPIKTYILVWVALLFLTGITIGASYVNMYKFTVFTAFFIATIKVTLVLLYFMHIRYEKPLYTWMIVAVLITYGIFIGLTYADYQFRW